MLQIMAAIFLKIAELSLQASICLDPPVIPPLPTAERLQLIRMLHKIDND